MKKKTRLVVCLVALLSLLGLSSLFFNRVSEEKGRPTVQNNYYQHVNYSWLQRTQIPAYKSSVSAISELSDEANYNLSLIWDGLLKGTINEDKEGFLGFKDYYAQLSDFSKRDKDGAAPFLETNGAKIQEMTDFSSFVGKVEENVRLNLMMPFGISVGTSAMDTSRKTIELTTPALILPDTTLYENQDTKEAYQDAYTRSMVATLKLMGFGQSEAQTMVKNTLKYDELLAKYSLSSEEASNMANLVNEMPLDKLPTYSKSIDLPSIIKGLVTSDDIIVNVSNEKFYKAFDTIINQDNYQLIQDWMFVNEAYYAKDYLSEDIRQAAGQYENFIYGTESLYQRDDIIFNDLVEMYEEQFSVYYGKHYFDEKTKNEAEEMVNHIIATFKERLGENDWLTEETKEKAIKKLDAMTVLIGAPKKVSRDNLLISIDKSKPLFENLMDFTEEQMNYRFDHYDEAVEKYTWDMTSYTVNAAYSPFENSIILLAAILAEPFFGNSQTDEENYGGIGTVIAHEITHGFDDNGALFDEDGNMKDWWTSEDYAAFKEKTNKVVDLFDGISIYGGKVNGRLTVTENTADLGGLAVAYEALLDTKEAANLEKFFKSYAISWRSKTTDETGFYLLATNEHAPDELRTNVQLSNFSPFYDVYDIQKSDEMYLAPEERVTIW